MEQKYRGQLIQPKTLKFRKLHPKAKLPTRGTSSAAGYDLYLAEDLLLSNNFATVMARFGIAVEIPEGYCGLLLERSSTHKMNAQQVNSVGIIDSDYRGELMVPMVDNSATAAEVIIGTDSNDCSIWGTSIPAGTRLSQLVIVPVLTLEPEWVEELSTTERGEGGFGSTNTK